MTSKQLRHYHKKKDAINEARRQIYKARKAAGACTICGELGKCRHRTKAP